MNEARDALIEIITRCMGSDNDWQAGQLKVVAETAEWQVFQVLNHASCYMDEPLTDEVLHNRKETV